MKKSITTVVKNLFFRIQTVSVNQYDRLTCRRKGTSLHEWHELEISTAEEHREYEEMYASLKEVDDLEERRELEQREFSSGLMEDEGIRRIEELASNSKSS